MNFLCQLLLFKELPLTVQQKAHTHAGKGGQQAPLCLPRGTQASFSLGIPTDAEGRVGTRPGEYTVESPVMRNACGSGLTNLHVIMLLTVFSDWQCLNLHSFLLYLGSSYISLKASNDRVSEVPFLLCQPDARPFLASHIFSRGNEGSHHGSVIYRNSFANLGEMR